MPTTASRSKVHEPDIGIPIALSGAVLRAPKASETVARMIVHDIRERRLQPGDGLESEAEMLASYNVSRESLREGLRLLETSGMITIRRGPGGGPVVGTVDPANLGRMQALFFHLAGATYDELFDVWVFAESTLANRAAAHEDAELRRSMMEPYTDGGSHHDDPEDLELFVEGHEGFHGAVAKLANNRVLQLSFRSFGQLVAHHVATVGDPRALKEALAEDHVKIATAIIDGDRDGASRLMEAHLKQVIEANKEQLGDLIQGPVEWL